jgi:hypothetical protein
LGNIKIRFLWKGGRRDRKGIVNGEEAGFINSAAARQGRVETLP